MSSVIDLHGRSLLTLADYAPDEIRFLIDLAAELKAAKKEGREEQKLVGKNIALIFEKDSTRTRCAFEVAAYDQGAHVTFIGPTGSHIGHKETVKDTARVLGRMYDAIEYRGFGQDIAEELARWAGVPVFNGLTDEWHPDADARRLPDLQRARRQAVRGDRVLLPRRRALQHGRQLPRLRCQAGDGRPHRQPALAVAPGGDRRAGRRGRGGDGREDHDHRERGRSGEGLRLLLTDVWVSMGEPKRPGRSGSTCFSRTRSTPTMALTATPT